MTATTVITWAESEWDETTQAAILNGIEGVVIVDPEPGDNPEWFWVVKATATRCEWPEVIDSGTAFSEFQAQIDASAAMRDADATYPHITY